MTSPSIELTELQTETIIPGFTRSWMFDKRIVVFRGTGVERTIVDAWVNCVKETMLQWPPNQIYLAVHDFTMKELFLTPYARKRAEELIPLSTQTPGHAAILLTPTVTAHLIRLFLRTQRRSGNDNQIFFNKADAIKWLLSKSEPRTKG